MRGPCLTTLNGQVDIPLGLGFIMLITQLSRELQDSQRLGTKSSLLNIHKILVLKIVNQERKSERHSRGHSVSPSLNSLMLFNNPCLSLELSESDTGHGPQF